MTRTASMIANDPQLARAATVVRWVVVAATLLPFVGCIPLGFSPKIIAFAIPALFGILGIRRDGWALFAVLYLPFYHGASFYALLAIPVLGSLPIVVGVFLWMLYIQAILFIKAQAESSDGADSQVGLAVASDGSTIVKGWVRQAGLAALLGLVASIVVQLPLGPFLVLALLFGALAYSVHVYLQVAS